MTTPLPRTTGRLIAFRNDRLGARLTTLVSAMRMARAYDLPLQVHWNIATDIGHIFNDPTEFFDAGFVTDHFIDVAAWRALRDDAIRINDIAGGGPEAVQHAIATGKAVLVDAGFNITVLAGEDPAAVSAQRDAVWQSFPFAASLAGPLADIRANTDGGTAYHIRRGDLTTFPRAMNRAWPAKYIPDDFYLTHMEGELAKGIRPVLFSDDAGTVARFHAAYPGLILAGSLFDADAVTAGQRDLLELYAMSRCARIIAPGNSAFSTTAATLGGAIKLDVTQDLTIDQQEAAKDRLVHRLNHLKEPEILAAQGDIGQSLPHLANHLQGRPSKAGRIIGGLITRGLGISFAYPMAMEQLLAAGEFAEAARIGAVMYARGPYHRKDQARGAILHALAQIGLGDMAAARRHMAVAYWHEPDQSHVREAVGAAVECGLLSGETFLPVTDAMRRLRRRATPTVDTHPAFAVLRAALVETGNYAATGASLDPVRWDWFAFTRAGTVGDVAGHPHRAGFDKSLAKLLKTEEDPDAESLSALYEHHVSPDPLHLETLSALALIYPDDAMVQHRLSAGALASRVYKVAIEAAEAAAALSDLPAHIGWRGMLRVRAKDFAGAALDLQAALDAGLILPRLHLFLAQARQRLTDQDGMLAALADGLTYAPLYADLRMMRAVALMADGQAARAMPDLDILALNDARTPKTLQAQIDCAIAIGRPDLAEVSFKQSLTHAPGDPVLLKALESLRQAMAARAA